MEHYDLDFHRAMEAAYKRQLSLQSLEVYEADYVRFTKLCTRHGLTMLKCSIPFSAMANEFKPALPKQGKWSVGDNKYDEEGQNPNHFPSSSLKTALMASAATSKTCAAR